ncbi:MAG: TetR/AcrR family transcriptional regulator [Pseudomonadota bacterium]
MPKLKPETQRARQQHILDAAEACFVRTGFHKTSMQDICAQADLSAGALYAHFNSKEDLILGIVERETEAFLQRLTTASGATTDLVSALNELARHYVISEPREKNRLFIEIGTEASRNPAIASVFMRLNQAVKQSIAERIEAAIQAGHIEPDLPPEGVADAVCLLGDGLCWRRAVDIDFDANTTLPRVISLIEALLQPVGNPSMHANASNPSHTETHHNQPHVCPPPQSAMSPMNADDAVSSTPTAASARVREKEAL